MALAKWYVGGNDRLFEVVNEFTVDGEAYVNYRTDSSSASKPDYYWYVSLLENFLKNFNLKELEVDDMVVFKDDIYKTTKWKVVVLFERDTGGYAVIESTKNLALVVTEVEGLQPA